MHITLTSTSKARGCRCLHSLPSVVPVFGETVDNRSLCCLFLPLFSVKHRYKYACKQILAMYPTFMWHWLKISVYNQVLWVKGLQLPLQPFFGLLPLGHLCPAVVIVFLSRRADMLWPVVTRFIRLRKSKYLGTGGQPDRNPLCACVLRGSDARACNVIWNVQEILRMVDSYSRAVFTGAL